jgi:hypothetical protein
LKSWGRTAIVAMLEQSRLDAWMVLEDAHQFCPGIPAMSDNANGLFHD